MHFQLATFPKGYLRLGGELRVVEGEPLLHPALPSGQAPRLGLVDPGGVVGDLLLVPAPGVRALLPVPPAAQAARAVALTSPVIRGIREQN